MTFQGRRVRPGRIHQLRRDQKDTVTRAVMTVGRGAEGDLEAPIYGATLGCGDVKTGKGERCRKIRNPCNRLR